MKQTQRLNVVLYRAESVSLDDDWERDFDDDDLEVTEEEIKLAAEAAKKLALAGNTGGDDDDVRSTSTFCDEGPLSDQNVQ